MATKKNTEPVAFWKIDTCYFIRTVTHHLTGRLVGWDEHELILVDAAWIAEDGRYAEAMKTGNLVEVEPYPDGLLVAVGRGSIVDATTWAHTLPRATK
jgi:hypothetical protein